MRKDSIEETGWTKISEELAKPFDSSHIRVKPGKIGSNGQALALWYIDARAVMDRLDSVIGSENWEFSWSPISADGRVVIQGILTVMGVTKSDVGEARGEDEPWKSGVSDAFKRTAVQFGIGRFLYKLPQIWWPYDEQYKRFAQTEDLNEFVDKVMKDLEKMDGDVTKINAGNYSDLIPSRKRSSYGSRQAPSQAQPGETAAKSDLTSAQEGYIRRLYTRNFGRFTNGNVLFANFLKERIGKVCTIEKLSRAEADIVIKGLQDLANAA